MTRLQFTDMFGFYNEPIVGVKNGKISVFNTSALKFFPIIEAGMGAADFFPEMFLDGTERAAGLMKYLGREVPVVAVTMSGLRIITVMKDMREEEEDSYYIPLSMASGEIRSALSTLIMSSNLLDSYRTIDPQNKKAANYRSIQQQSMYRILRIAENMNDVFGVDVMFDDKEAVEFNIIDTCMDMVSTVAHVAAYRRISVEYEGTQEKLLFKGFEDRIEKMLLQVFSNSLKYTPDGGKIKLTLLKNQGNVIIKITDNGCGVSADIMPTVFMRYRERRDIRDPNAGIGLGLSVVSRIARIHEGAALLDSRVGKGTTVTIYLKNPADPGVVFRSDDIVKKPRDMRLVLVQLSDAIDYPFYCPQYID